MSEKFPISKSLVEVERAMSRGDNVLWHRDLHLLLCFKKSLRVRMGSYVSRYVPPGYFDALTSLHDTDTLIGVQFWSMGYLLRQSNELIASMQPDGSLDALAVLEAAETRRLARLPEPLPTRDELVDASRKFLTENKIYIPEHTWRMAISYNS